jgi:lipopolysaccharide transport system permease protein
MEHRGMAGMARPNLFRTSPIASSRSERTEQVLVLEPGRAEQNYWADLWSYRELFAILVWRDLAVRYKQTAIGVAWAVIRPILTVLILTAVFGRLAKLPSDGNAPYLVMVYAGMLPWFLMSTILTEASNSLINHANLISKVYFPRLMVPSAFIGVALVDFVVSFVLLLAIMIWSGFWPDWRIVCLPAFILLAVLAALGVGLLISAMNVKYRDFRYIVPFALQVGLYISPVGFSSSVVPEQWRLVYSLNPAVGVLDGFRWCLLRGEATLYIPGFFLNLGIIALLVVWGVRYFRRTERTFTDLL